MPIMAIGSRWTQMLSSFLRGNNRDRFANRSGEKSSLDDSPATSPTNNGGPEQSRGGSVPWRLLSFMNRSRLFPRKNDDNIWVHREPMAIIGIADHGFD